MSGIQNKRWLAKLSIRCNALKWKKKLVGKPRCGIVYVYCVGILMNFGKNMAREGSSMLAFIT